MNQTILENNVVLGGLVAVTTLLLVAAIFGRVHGEGGGDGQLGPIGDRVISGLLALPLIAFWVKLFFPHAHLLWALAAPVPLAIYVVLLAITDVNISTNADAKWNRVKKPLETVKNHFTAILLVGVVTFYAVLAVVAMVVR